MLTFTVKVYVCVLFAPIVWSSANVQGPVPANAPLALPAASEEYDAELIVTSSSYSVDPIDRDEK